MRKLSSVLFLFLACVLVSQSARAEVCNSVLAVNNLVSNCGFETGNYHGWSGTVLTDPFSYAGVDGSSPYAGSFSAYFGPPSNETLYQNLNTVTGTSYTIDFAVANEGNPAVGYNNDFIASFGASTLLTLTNIQQTGYTLYSFTATATSASTQLLFTSENQDSFWDLDSVSVKAIGSVAATPEPSSLVLLGTGALGLAGAVRRRIKR